MLLLLLPSFDGGKLCVDVIHISTDTTDGGCGGSQGCIQVVKFSNYFVNLRLKRRVALYRCYRVVYSIWAGDIDYLIFETSWKKGWDYVYNWKISEQLQ